MWVPRASGQACLHPWGCSGDQPGYAYEVEDSQRQVLQHRFNVKAEQVNLSTVGWTLPPVLSSLTWETYFKFLDTKDDKESSHQNELCWNVLGWPKSSGKT